MRYSINSGELPYEKAAKLSKDLRAAKVDANITVGGIAIHTINGVEEERMISICKKYGVTPKPGVTDKEGDVVFERLPEIYHQ